MSRKEINTAVQSPAREAAEAEGWYRANGARGEVSAIIHDEYEERYDSWEGCCEDQQIEIDDPNAVDYLRSPFGNEIVATLEIIPGQCDGSYEDGEFEHGGETDVGWDGQETVIRAGQRVFLCDAGCQWLESELVKPGEQLPEVPLSPWDDVENIQKFLAEKHTEVTKVVMEDVASGDVTPGQQQEIDNALMTLARIALTIRQQNQPK